MTSTLRRRRNLHVRWRVISVAGDVSVVDHPPTGGNGWQISTMTLRWPPSVQRSHRISPPASSLRHLSLRDCSPKYPEHSKGDLFFGMTTTMLMLLLLMLMMTTIEPTMRTMWRAGGQQRNTLLSRVAVAVAVAVAGTTTSERYYLR